MGAYSKYFKTNFLAESTYKADFFFDIGSDIIFFLILFYLWRTIYLKTGVSDISSFSLSTTITYYFITNLLFRFNPSESIYLNEEIWEGWFTNEMPRPYSLKFIYVVSAFARMAVGLLVYIPFAAFLFIFAYDYMVFPSPINFLYFIIAMSLSAILGICFYLFLHSLSFHFGDQDANLTLVSYLAAFLGGALFPLRFLPANLYTIVYHLPFKYLFDFPANIYLGKIATTEIIYSFIEIIAWIVLFYCFYHISFQRGLKKYTAVGR